LDGFDAAPGRSASLLGCKNGLTAGKISKLIYEEEAILNVY